MVASSPAVSWGTSTDQAGLREFLSRRSVPTAIWRPAGGLESRWNCGAALFQSRAEPEICGGTSLPSCNGWEQIQRPVSDQALHPRFWFGRPAATHRKASSGGSGWGATCWTVGVSAWRSDGRKWWSKSVAGSTGAITIDMGVSWKWKKISQDNLLSQLTGNPLVLGRPFLSADGYVPMATGYRLHALINKGYPFVLPISIKPPLNPDSH